MDTNPLDGLIAESAGELDSLYVRIKITGEVTGAGNDRYRLTVEFAGFRPQSWTMTSIDQCKGSLLTMILTKSDWYVGFDVKGFTLTASQSEELIARIHALADSTAAEVPHGQ